MDQDAVVTEQLESGRRVIASLEEIGFDIRLAFWAKPVDESKWYLYLASPFVDDKGPAAAYDLVFGLVRKQADLWIEPLDIKVIGLNDSLTRAALLKLKPKVLDGPFAAKNPRPYPGMTRLNSGTFGGLGIEAAIAYPLAEQAARA